MHIPKTNRLHLALASGGLGLSILALVLGLVGGCGSCQDADVVGLGIAAAGIAGYALLVALGMKLKWTAFAAGVAVAAGVHVVLVVWMVQSGRLCPVCIGAAIAAFINFGIALAGGLLKLPILEKSFFPALLVAGGFAAAALAGQARAEANRSKELARLATETAVNSQASQVSVTIFESDHCPYCRTLRELYAPRLHRDFGGAIDLRYVPATEASWVSRTPTVVVGGGQVFEGLPSKYEDLKDAIESALSGRSTQILERNP